MADIFFGKFSELISRETPEVKKDKFNLDKENKKTQSEKKIYLHNCSNRFFNFFIL